MRTEGYVSSTKPLSHQGTLIDNISVRFEGGRIVEAKASRGEEVLKKVLDTDEGARRLGEVALVPPNTSRTMAPGDAIDVDDKGEARLRFADFLTVRVFRRAGILIEGDVDPRTLPGTDLLADIEHRRFVALALADDDCSLDGKSVEFAPHRIDRRLVGSHFIAAAP